MQTILTGFLASVLCIVAALSVVGQPPPPQPAGVPRRIVNDAPGRGNILVPYVPPSLDLDKETAGLSKGSLPELLTWERVYALALVRGRDGRRGFAEALDPKALAELTARHGVADFARFRKEFLTSRSGAGGTFRDPSRDYLTLLRQLQTIDNARRNVAVHENLMQFVVTLVQGESAGLSMLDVDLVFASLHRARQRLANAIRDFRDGLDDMKVALGLSPHAPVIPDRQSLAAFRAAFDAIESWSASPHRNLPGLFRLFQKLPPLGELVVDGQPVLGTIEANPDPGQDVLASAVRLAITNRNEPAVGPSVGDADAKLELRVRRRVRHLFETRRAYEGEKRSFELAMRLRDQAFERMVSPPTARVSGRSPLLDGLLGHLTQILQDEDRLVTLWTSFRVQRLSLYRELGVLPYSDWASFYQDLSAN
jgi:hypothetical protein